MAIIVLNSIAINLKCLWLKLVRVESMGLIDMFTIFPNPSAQAGYNTRAIFKRTLTGLNPVFSFSKTNCLTKAEETSLPYYFPYLEVE